MHVCVLVAYWQPFLLAWKVKEGQCVSMTTHLLVALYKARRGGKREVLTVTVVQGTWGGIGEAHASWSNASC